MYSLMDPNAPPASVLLLCYVTVYVVDAALINPIHPRIVRSAVVDEDARIGFRGQRPQHFGQLSGGELARAAGARRIVRQSLHRVGLQADRTC